jgi:hypothetical protein
MGEPRRRELPTLSARPSLGAPSVSTEREKLEAALWLLRWYYDAESGDDRGSNLHLRVGEFLDGGLSLAELQSRAGQRARYMHALFGDDGPEARERALEVGEVAF